MRRIDAVRGRDVQHHPGLRPGEHAHVHHGAGQAGRPGHRAGEAGVVEEPLDRPLGEQVRVDAGMDDPHPLGPGEGGRAEPAYGLQREVLGRVLRVGPHLLPQPAGGSGQLVGPDQVIGLERGGQVGRCRMGRPGRLGRPWRLILRRGERWHRLLADRCGRRSRVCHVAAPWLGGFP
jgi:hypothetical protein